ncbi:MAG: deltex-like protein [Bacillariaceae sp.]|jgi:deltex-like protein
MNNANSHHHHQQQQQQPIFQTPLSYNAPDLSLVSMFSCFGSGPSGTMVAEPPKITLNSNAIGYIKISYSIPSAIQKSYHPKPGVLHNGITRKAYLPYTTEGRELLLRLQFGFLHGLNFSVGRSLASGRDDQVTWSHSVPHKTSKTGGPSLFGFPDVAFLPTLRLSLDQLRVPSDTNTCRQWIMQNQHSIAMLSATTLLSAAPTMIPPVALLGSGATSCITTATATSVQNEQINYQAPSQSSTIDHLSQYLEPVVFDIKNNESSIGNNNATVNNGNQAGKENDWDECPICLDVLHQTSGAVTSTVVRLKKCRHCFHKDCIVNMFQSQHNKCPTCREPIDGEGFGQGPSGSMTITLISGTICPGFEYDCNGVIEIYYR